MNELTSLVLEYPLLEGAVKSGIATRDTLAGGPESVDLSYVLPDAKSAIVFFVPLDQTPLRIWKPGSLLSTMICPQAAAAGRIMASRQHPPRENGAKRSNVDMKRFLNPINPTSQRDGMPGGCGPGPA